MESLSCLILLSWWNIAFGHLESYQIIAYELYNVWIRLIPQIVEKASLIIDQFSSYPEHLNLFIINLLRIYVDHNFQKENVWKLSKDTASQMTGIHSSVNMHGLIGIYRKSIEQLNINNTKSLSTINTLSQTVSINTTCLAIVEILKRLVRYVISCLKYCDRIHSDAFFKEGTVSKQLVKNIFQLKHLDRITMFVVNIITRSNPTFESP